MSKRPLFKEPTELFKKPTELKVVIVLSLYMLPFVAYWGLRTYASLMQGYAWNEMDWNEDGRTTLGEFFDAGDIGSREITLNGKRCIEYFRAKDTGEVKTVCEPRG